MFSDWPVPALKKWVWVSSSFAHTGSSAPRHETAGGAGAQELVADLEVDDVVGAERLDDVRLDRNVAGARFARDQDRLRADAKRELAVPLTGRRDPLRQCRRKVEGDAVVADDDLGPGAIG